jgi:DNA-binding response OmpR family regulator
VTAPVSQKILIVDDDPDLSRAIATFLKGNGYAALIAYDATTAIKYLRRETVLLVILDIGLPGGGGLFVLNNIRSLKDKDALPIIVHTANISDGLREDALALEANEFVPKPCDLEILLEKIKALLPPG